MKTEKEIKEMMQDIENIISNYEELYKSGQISKEFLEVMTLEHKGELNALEWVLS